MASDEPLMASVDLWPLNWAPRNWALCQGQLLAVNQYSALFALLGPTYGGNGTTNFALPNFQDRVPVGVSSTKPLASTGGAENIALQLSNLPSHSHIAAVTVAIPTAIPGSRSEAVTPEGNYLGPSTTSDRIYGPKGTGVMGAPTVQATIQPTGSGVPFSTHSPYLAVNYILALAGIFPTRD